MTAEQPRSLKRRMADDWLPPAMTRAIRERRATTKAPAAAASTPSSTESLKAPAAAPAAAPTTYDVNDDPRWAKLNARALEELKVCDELYRPTNFWGPSLEQLLGDLDRMGLERFKSWPRATFWFQPYYGNKFSNKTIQETFKHAKAANPHARKDFVIAALNGSYNARRDYDAARLAWDNDRWPIDLTAHGESSFGTPWQRYRLLPDNQDLGFTRPYLNYMLMMAALSRHVDAPPKSVLEIGGGYGSLGEFLMAHDPELRYVDLDIPPLVTVASYYLTELFGDERVLTYNDEIPTTGKIDTPRSACLPNYRLPDLTSSFDLFVNSFSFQEMEPHVVDNYVQKVADLGVTYVASLNSLKGKPKASDGHAIGVVDPVTSPRIIEMFGKRGFELLGTYDQPLIQSAGQIAILRRR